MDTSQLSPDQLLDRLPFTRHMRRIIRDGIDGEDAAVTMRRVVSAIRTTDGMPRLDSFPRFLRHEGFVGCRFYHAAHDQQAAWQQVRKMYAEAGRFLASKRTERRVELSSWMVAIHHADWPGKGGAGRTDHRVMLALVERAWYASSLTFMVGERTLARHTMLNRKAVRASLRRLEQLGLVTRTGGDPATSFTLPDDLPEQLRYNLTPPVSWRRGNDLTPHKDSSFPIESLRESLYGGDAFPIAGVELSPTAGGDTSKDSSHERIAGDQSGRDWQPGTYAHWRLIHPAFHPSTGLDYQLWCVLPEGARRASLQYLARLLGRHTKTVSGALAKLKAAGLATGDSKSGWRCQSDRRILAKIVDEHGVYLKIAAQVERDRDDHIGRPTEQQIEDRKREREQSVVADLAQVAAVADPFDLDTIEVEFSTALDRRGLQAPSDEVYAQIGAALDAEREAAKAEVARRRQPPPRSDSTTATDDGTDWIDWLNKSLDEPAPYRPTLREEIEAQEREREVIEDWTPTSTNVTDAQWAAFMKSL